MPIACWCRERSVNVLLVALLAIGAGCKERTRFAHPTTEIRPDGAHIKVLLIGVDEVEIAGQRMRDGQTIVVPFSQLQVGANRLPVIAEGLRANSVAVFDVPVSTVFTLKCATQGERGTASIKLSPAPGAPEQSSPASDPSTSGSWVGCPVEGGQVMAPLDVLAGFTAAVDGGPPSRDRLRIDLRPGMWKAAVKQGSDSVSLPDSEHSLTITSASGKAWTGALSVTPPRHLMDGILDGLPGSAEGMPPGAGLAAVKVHGIWWFEGEATTLGEIDWWVHAVDHAAPRPLPSCDFDSLDLGRRRVTLAVTGVDDTYAIRDRQGREVARKTFVAKGCPGAASIKPGQTSITIRAAEPAVRAWVREQRKQHMAR